MKVVIQIPIYNEQILNEQMTPLENSLIPGWSNTIDVTFKPEMVVNAADICTLQEVMPGDRIYANHIPDRLSD